MEIDRSEIELRREYTANIVAAYVGNNHVTKDELPSLIGTIFAALDLSTPAAVEEKPADPLVPAVPVKKSVTPDYLVCLEDGKKFKSLKRHLATHYDLTPEAYRAKWGLPSDYPMVAANYAAKRSELAKSIGLGRKAKAAEPAKAEEPAPAKKRGARAKPAAKAA